MRRSNIYVRGYLGLRAWSLRLRAWIGEDHYERAAFSLRGIALFPPLDERNLGDRVSPLPSVSGYPRAYRGAGARL